MNSFSSGIGKVVAIDLLRLPSAILSRILQLSQWFFLLGVHRDRWLSLPLLLLHATIDVAKLGVSIRMRVSFARLAVGLQTVARLLEQVPHGGWAHGVSLSHQFLGQAPRALACPTQRGLRVTSAIGFNQSLQGRFDTWVNNFNPFATRTRTALPPTRRRVTPIQFSDSSPDGAVSQTGRRTHSRDAADTQRNRLHRSPTASRELRQIVAEPSILTLDPLNNSPIHDERDSLKLLQLLSRSFSSTYLLSADSKRCHFRRLGEWQSGFLGCRTPM